MIFMAVYSVFRWREGKDPDPEGFLQFMGVVELIVELALAYFILEKVLP